MDTERDGDSMFGHCGGEGDIFTTVDTDFDVMQEDVMLQLDAIGSQISFWAWRPDESMPSKPLASVEDNRIANGEIGLWMNDIPVASVRGAYRFVHIADTHIPEPSTLLLAIVALGVIGGWRRWSG